MNITHGLRRVLQVNPDGLATAFGTRRRTWRETGERVARLAERLGGQMVAASLERRLPLAEEIG